MGGDLDEGRLLADALEQVELADRLGIDYVWEVEHHFLEEYSHSSAPEVFLAAASQRPVASGSATGSSRCPRRQPPGAGRGADRDARPDLRRPGRVRDRGGELADRAGRIRRRPRVEAGPVGGVARRDHPDVRGGAVRRLRRPVDLDAAAKRDPQAEAAPAPAALGGLQPARDDPDGRRARPRRALVLVRRARGGEGVGRRLLRDMASDDASPRGSASTRTWPWCCR